MSLPLDEVIDKVITASFTKAVAKREEEVAGFEAKVTPEHIGELIRNADKANERDSTGKKWRLGGVIVCLTIVALALCYICGKLIDKDKTEAVLQILAYVAVYVGGLGTPGIARAVRQSVTPSPPHPPASESTQS